MQCIRTLDDAIEDAEDGMLPEGWKGNPGWLRQSNKEMTVDKFRKILVCLRGGIPDLENIFPE